MGNWRIYKNLGQGGLESYQNVFMNLVASFIELFELMKTLYSVNNLYYSSDWAMYSVNNL